MVLEIRKIAAWGIVFVCFVASVFFQGCATAGKNIPLANKNLSAMPSLRVVRYKTPRNIIVKNNTCLLMNATIGTALFPVIGTAAGVIVSVGTVEKKIPRPDFGELVMEKFIDRAGREIPHWPVMTIEKEPIGFGYKFEAGALLVFKVLKLSIDPGKMEFSSITSVMIKDINGNVLWEKFFTYKGGQFERRRSLDDFKADNGAFIEEEMEFAAEATVADFLQEFPREGNMDIISHRKDLRDAEKEG